MVIDGYTMANLVAAHHPEHQQDPARSPRPFTRLAIGDHATLVGSSAGADDGAPTGVVGYGLIYGVFCREGAAFTDTPEILATARRVLPRTSTGVAGAAGTPIIDECAVWCLGAPTQPCANGVSEVPALLLTGTLGLGDVTQPGRSRRLGFPERARRAYRRFRPQCAEQLAVRAADHPRLPG